MTGAQHSPGGPLAWLANLDAAQVCAPPRPGQRAELSRAELNPARRDKTWQDKTFHAIAYRGMLRCCARPGQAGPAPPSQGDILLTAGYFIPKRTCLPRGPARRLSLAVFELCRKGRRRPWSPQHVFEGMRRRSVRWERPRGDGRVRPSGRVVEGVPDQSRSDNGPCGIRERNHRWHELRHLRHGLAHLQASLRVQQTGMAGTRAGARGIGCRGIKGVLALIACAP